MVVVIFDFIWGSRKGAELLLSDPTRHCGLEPLLSGEAFSFST